MGTPPPILNTIKQKNTCPKIPCKAKPESSGKKEVKHYEGPGPLTLSRHRGLVECSFAVTIPSKTELEFPLQLSGLRTRHSVYEDGGSIPGLTQWLKDLVLP